MARSSMAALISQTRDLIADTGSPPVLSDDTIEQALDRRRIEQRHVPLQPNPTFQPGGAVLYLDFYANVGQWEDDVILQDVGYTVITAAVSEPIVGHWHFTSQPSGFGVRATGKTYDLYGAAADLLESWAAKVKLEFDLQSDGDTFNRSQKGQAMRELAADYRKRALATTSLTAQSEYLGDVSGNAVTYPAYDLWESW